MNKATKPSSGRNSFILVRDQLLDAIGAFEAEEDPQWGGTHLGLCSAFWLGCYRSGGRQDDCDRLARRVPGYLRALGGFSEGAFFWPRTEEGSDQRRMMLAFMLTWLEDLEGRG